MERISCNSEVFSLDFVPNSHSESIFAWGLLAFFLSSSIKRLRAIEKSHVETLKLVCKNQKLCKSDEKTAV